MCLGIPGKVLSLTDVNGMRMAKVQFGGIVREACLEYTPEAKVGEYVVIHAGFAISKVDEEEAARTYRLLEEMGQLTELEAPAVEDSPGPVEDRPEAALHDGAEGKAARRKERHEDP